MGDNTEENKNGTLSEVVSALVSSFAQARSVADVQTLRIANRYRQNEFLKGLPVPRLRLQRVSISLPMIVSGMIEGKDAVPRSTEELAEKLKSLFFNQLRDTGNSFSNTKKLLARSQDQIDYDEFIDHVFQYMELGNRENEIKDAFRSAFVKIYNQELLNVRLSHGPHEPSDALISEAAEESVEDVIQEVMRELLFKALEKHVAHKDAQTGKGTKQAAGEPFDRQRAWRSIEEKGLTSEWMKKIIHNLRYEAGQRAIRIPSVASDLLIAVNTDDIKNAGGGPDTVTRFNMVLLEEGLEWVTERSEGGEESTKLIRE